MVNDFVGGVGGQWSSAVKLHAEYEIYAWFSAHAHTHTIPNEYRITHFCNGTSTTTEY